MKKVSKRFILLILSVFIALSLGCAREKLTSEKAKSIIIEHFKYPQPVYKGLSAGKNAYYYRKNQESEKQKKINDLFDPLAKEGLITYNSHPSGYIDVFATEKGREYVSGRIREDRYDMVNIKVAEKHFFKVTSISPGDGTKAQVEYTWKFGNITPFGKYMKSEKWKNTALKKEKVQMCLYDDGWKVCD
jgi:hypothetical protein